jgi:hypothetical protein
MYLLMEAAAPIVVLVVLAADQVMNRRWRHAWVIVREFRIRTRTRHL